MKNQYVTLALLCPVTFSSLPISAKDTKGKVVDREKPNVIIIYADDLGYGDLQCYGAKNVETPNVNRLATEDIRFTNAHAVAATSTPSQYSLLTGKYAWCRPDTDIAAGNHVLSVCNKDWKYIEPNDGPAMITWGPKIETGNLSVPQLYEMNKVTERENVASRYPDKVFELQNILRRVRLNQKK